MEAVMHGIENSNRNKHAVISSAIVAKAVVQREDGRINLLVVFQESTTHEFYWVFQAKSARSARKSWRYVSQYGRDFNTAEKPYRDFGSFVAHYARLNHAEVRTLRVQHVRRLATLLAKTTHESIHSDWSPRIDSTDPRSYRKLNTAFARNIKGRVLDGWR
jgi:hypothetical protein